MSPKGHTFICLNCGVTTYIINLMLGVHESIVLFCCYSSMTSSQQHVFCVSLCQVLLCTAEIFPRTVMCALSSYNFIFANTPHAVEDSWKVTKYVQLHLEHIQVAVYLKSHSHAIHHYVTIIPVLCTHQAAFGVGLLPRPIPMKPSVISWASKLWLNKQCTHYTPTACAWNKCWCIDCTFF